MIYLSLLIGFLWFQVIAHVGISAGVHRHFAHRQFKAPVWFQWISLYLTVLAGSLSPIGWIAAHRMHHTHSDTAQDPHSPKYKGFWYVFFSSWNLKKIPRRIVKDLYKNKRLKFFHRHWGKIWIVSSIVSFSISPYVFVSFIVIPAILGRLGFGMVNAITHKTGKVENVPWINILTAGEGYHKEHHTNGNNIRFHKYDLTGYILEKIIK